ncbi:transposase (plasmid) [Lichenicola cladoniae]|uniref:Transposase n=1 Tax=Lichenicola cladoniae TaxID=1484109 RepID=A0A6M8HZA7_9PROT|nr:transposase [Acetobacteraceae bacterium]QKE93722.1 transposase [Lichenicola cladoniae]
MRTDSEWSLGSGAKVSSTSRTDDGWIVAVVLSGEARCPACGTCSSRRHGWCVRHLQDLPAQGAAVALALRMPRWRCLNPGCSRKTFGDRLPQIVAPYGRRTRRVVKLAHVLAHTAGGRPAGRLIARLGMPRARTPSCGR